MNKRKKKRMAAAAGGLLQQGQKIFEVTVKETFEKTYTVFAKSADEAEEIASDKCNNGEYDPSAEKDSEYDNDITAEEVKPCLNHFKPLEFVKFRGHSYPVWAVKYGKERRLVSTETLERALFKDDGRTDYVSADAKRIDDRFAFFADPTTPIQDIVEAIWDVELKTEG